MPPRFALPPSHLLMTHVAGMFKYDEQSHFHWFNQNSFENTQEFRLIGIMFGLGMPFCYG